jgi:hypothetical protein
MTVGGHAGRHHVAEVAQAEHPNVHCVTSSGSPAQGPSAPCAQEHRAGGLDTNLQAYLGARAPDGGKPPGGEAMAALLPWTITLPVDRV